MSSGSKPTEASGTKERWRRRRKGGFECLAPTQDCSRLDHGWTLSGVHPSSLPAVLVNNHFKSVACSVVSGPVQVDSDVQSLLEDIGDFWHVYVSQLGHSIKQPLHSRSNSFPPFFGFVFQLFRCYNNFVFVTGMFSDVQSRGANDWWFEMELSEMSSETRRCQTHCHLEAPSYYYHRPQEVATLSSKASNLYIISLFLLFRFYFKGYRREKISTSVDFPLTNLDLNRYVSGPHKRRPYKLFAVSVRLQTSDLICLFCFP